MYTHKHLGALSVLFLLLVIGTVFFNNTPQPVEANNPAATDELTGWAWSSNIGWIAFNCAVESPPCPNGDTPAGYAVRVDSTTGILSGWAWTQNAGWIVFNQGAGASLAPNNLSGCPSYASDPTSCKAVLLPADANGIRQLTGWARAVQASGNGGWDGFISLSPKGTTVTPNDLLPSTYNATANCLQASPPAGCYGPRMKVSDGTFSGFAWGGETIGWIDFGTFGATPAKPVTLVTADNALTASVVPQKIGILPGDSVVIDWATNAVGTCTRTSNPSIAAWNVASVTVPPGSGSITVTPPSTPDPKTYDFTLACSDSTRGNVTKTGSVTVDSTALNFDIDVPQNALQMSFVTNKQESTTQTTATVTGGALFTGPVTLSILPPNVGTQLPAGVTITPVFSKSNPVANEPVTVSFMLNKAIPQGTYTFRLHATDGTVSRDKDKDIIVTVKSFVPVTTEN